MRNSRRNSTTAKRTVRHLKEVVRFGAPSPNLDGRTIAILGIGDATASAIISALHAEGAKTVRIEGNIPTEIHSDRDEAAAALRRALTPHGTTVDGIIDLGLGILTLPKIRDSWIAQYRQTIMALEIVGPEWSRAGDANRYFYIALTRTGGELATPAAPENPHAGLWAGLAKALPLHYECVNTRVVDFPTYIDTQTLAYGLIRELYRWGSFEIGLLDGVRYRPVSVVEPTPAPILTLTDHDTALVTGSHIPVVCALSRRLIDTGTRVVAAVAPSAPRSQRSYLLRSGIEPRTCDITQQNEVNALITELGPHLSAVIHAEGADLTVEERNDPLDSANRLLERRIKGFLHLLDAVKNNADPAVISVLTSTTRPALAGAHNIHAGAIAELLSYVARWATQEIPPRTAVQTLTAGITDKSETAVYAHAWANEILATSEGAVDLGDRIEVTTGPMLARGYLAHSDVPGTRETRTALARIGRPEHYISDKSIAIRVDLAPAGDNANLDVRLEGNPCVPISVLVDQMVATAAWLTNDIRQRVIEIRHLTVNLRGLAEATMHLVRVAANLTHASNNTMHARHIEVTASCMGRQVAHAVITFAGSYPSRLHTPAIETTENIAYQHPIGPQEAPVTMVWTGLAFDRIGERDENSGNTRYTVRPDRLTDQFSPGFVPAPRIGYNLIENLAARSYPNSPATAFTIDRLIIHAPSVTRGKLFLEPATTEGGARTAWKASTTGGDVILEARGVAYNSGTACSAPACSAEEIHIQ
ncbi:Uncharacterised protein [Dermatophilus congolensis]|uniref:Uncharacterized protein n=1 Tax=Dermatophilus congolensis TaxID=1863 RepID=A0AA46BMT5_9MICO|nr:hypothetical protein [Dermatophilus congolensis]STD08311.1 Uncharacterised protein [Dermatophilus congolensis]